MKKEDLIIRKSFVLPYNNGELWAEELDSLYGFSEIVESKFLEDMKMIRRPSTPAVIAINLYQTLLTKHLAEIILKNLVDAGASVRKVAFIGLDREGLRMMKQEIKSSNANLVHEYFKDIDKAKEWLT